MTGAERPRSEATNALVAAIRSGDTEVVSRLLDEHRDLASGAVGGALGTRTPLHVVADWPGYFPNGPEVVRLLIAAGADPNARSPGKQFAETPLHWAASSDDVDVAAALIDGGADMEVTDGSIGTPLDNAVGYGCWHVARLLVARGARVDELWHAAALGLLTRLDQLLAERAASADDLSQAFWHACSGAQRRAAERLLACGADPNWVPTYAPTTALEAAKQLGTRRENVIAWLRDAARRPDEQSGTA